MTTRQFMLRTEQPPTDDQVRLLFSQTREVSVEVGAFRRWAAVVVDRGAPTLSDAIVRTVADVDTAGLVVLDVGPDDDIVPSSLIAERVGCPVSTVDRWATGQGGPTGFPAPVDLPGQAKYFRWCDVVPWLRSYLGLVLPDTQPIYTAVNLTLKLRALAPAVPDVGTIRSLLDTDPPFRGVHRR